MSSRLSPKCVKIARPTLFGYIATREEFEHYSNLLFGLLTSGALKVNIHGYYSLSDLQQAHKVSQGDGQLVSQVLTRQDLEGRKTTGKILIRITE